MEVKEILIVRAQKMPDENNPNASDYAFYRGYSFSYFHFLLFESRHFKNRKIIDASVLKELGCRPNWDPSLFYLWQYGSGTWEFYTLRSTS